MSTFPMAAIGEHFRQAARLALDAVLPPQCLCCGALIDQAGALCAGCWEKIGFIAPPLCKRCGTPFELQAPAGSICGGCLEAPPVFDRARAVVRYDDASRPLVLRFKHADRTEAAPSFVRWLLRAGGELVAEAELIVPVPLHRWRLLTRRYNQAALLARGLHRETGVPWLPDGLVRSRRTPSQGTLGRLQRARNVKGAFALTSAAAARVDGLRVLLVDDVLTSGATAAECARVLRRAGAAGVDLLTLARVV